MPTYEADCGECQQQVTIQSTYLLNPSEEAELRKDKARLDWLEKGKDASYPYFFIDKNYRTVYHGRERWGSYQGKTLREAVDAAMEGTRLTADQLRKTIAEAQAELLALTQGEEIA